MINILNNGSNSEHKNLDELLRELQDTTLNENWGYWHFTLLNLINGTDLEQKILNTLSQIPQYRDPYKTDNATGKKTYISKLDIANLTFKPINDLKSEIVSKANFWSLYQGPSSDKKEVSEEFYKLKYIVADKICVFLNNKQIINIKLVGGIDTFYSFGGDHTGDDILVETQAGVYVIHFGFSS